MGNASVLGNTVLIDNWHVARHHNSLLLLCILSEVSCEDARLSSSQTPISENIATKGLRSFHRLSKNDQFKRVEIPSDLPRLINKDSVGIGEIAFAGELHSTVHKSLLFGR